MVAGVDRVDRRGGFNPYFIGLPILIRISFSFSSPSPESFNPYFIGLPILILHTLKVNTFFFLVSILILLDYLFLLKLVT